MKTIEEVREILKDLNVEPFAEDDAISRFLLHQYKITSEESRLLATKIHFLHLPAIAAEEIHK